MPRKSHYDEHRLEVLRLIEAARRAHSKPMSVRDLADRTGVGVATMHLYLQRLTDEGLVGRRINRHRSFRCSAAGVALLEAEQSKAPTA